MPDTAQHPLPADEQIAQRIDVSALTRGRIVVVGLGGIGSILARYLLLFLSSLPDDFRVVLVDGDEFEQNNDYRMDVPAYANKASAMMADLVARFGREGLSVRSRGEYLSTKNCHEIIRDGDCVLLCVDNHATRKLASDCFGELDNGILISAGNDGVGEGERGTYGNLMVYMKEQGETIAGGPLDAFHPEIAEPDDHNPQENEDKDCMELVAAGAPQLLPTNLAMASAMLSAVARLIMPPAGESMYDEVCLDILDATTVAHWITRPQVRSQESRVKSQEPDASELGGDAKRESPQAT